MENDKILREPEVCAIVGMSPPTISRQEKAGLFPARRRIGKRAVGWLESEVQEWVARQAHSNQKFSSKRNRGDKQ